MPSFCVEGANIRGGSQKVTSSLPETVSELCFLLRRHLCFNLGDQNCQIVGIHYFNHTTQNWTPLLDRILSNLAPNGERLRVTCETNTTTCSKEATFYEEVVDLMLTSIKDKEVRGFVEDAVYDAKTAAIKDPCGSIADMRATRAFQRLIRLITGHQGILSVNKGRILNPANARHKSLDSCHNIYNITPSRTGDIQENYPASSDRVLRGASAAAYSSRSPTPNSSSLYSNGTSARNATPNQGSYVRDTKPLYEMPKVTPGRPTSAARMRYDVDKIEAHNYTPISMRSEATPTSEKPCATPGVSQLYSGNGPNSSGRKSALRRSSPEATSSHPYIPRNGYTSSSRPTSASSPISNITNSATRSLNSESSKSSDMITIYCVYSGTTSQRAKAIQTKRRNPGYDIILFTLRKKFGCDLSLGHIDDTGDCIEILSNEELRALALSTPGPSLSLQCWAKTSGVHFEDPNKMRNSFRETNASGEGGYNERLYSPSKRAVSSRASNGNSTDRSRISFTPSHILDVTNTAWTTSQLKEVFDALSINSGCATNSRGRGIDKLEMMAYFQQCHDDMGVLDSSKKFERLIDSNTKSKDGLISFDEFAVIMLKIAQW